MIVTLSWVEMASAAREGIQRRIRALALGRQLPGGWDAARKSGRWDNEVESACAERAAAKGLGIYWPEGSNPDYAGDLPGNRHVRSTDIPHGCLLVYDGDPDDGIFLLVIGQAPTFRLAGWMFGHEAKQDLYVNFARSRLARAGYMVPQCRLHPIEEEIT
jgi:hypothetical protein